MRNWKENEDNNKYIKLQFMGQGQPVGYYVNAIKLMCHYTELFGM